MTNHGPLATDWLFESPDSVAARLDAVNECQSRARRTIVIMAVVSAMTFFAAWNAYASYDYYWSRRQWETPLHERRISSTDVLREQALKSWSDSRNVGVPLLGIRISIDDAPVLATGSLALMAVWLLLTLRRENHTIGFLFRDTNEDPVDAKKEDLAKYHEIRWLIFHSIVSRTLLTNFNYSLLPISSLGGLNPTEESNHSRWFKLKRLAFGGVSALFVFFPAIVMFVVIAFDIISYHRPDPYMPANAKPDNESYGNYTLIISIPLWLFLVSVSWASFRYETATRTLLEKYLDLLRSSRSNQRHEEMAGLAFQGPKTVPHEKIAARAYEIWCGRGWPEGTHEEHWLEAESEYRKELNGTGL